MLYLIRLFITTIDSSSWMVYWWTVVRLFQSYRLLQSRNALPVAPNRTYPLQTDNAFVRISIPPDRVDDIKRFPRPKTPKELERFLGICAFFHRFVPHASGKMASLMRLKNISRQKQFDAAWLLEHDEASADVKAAITTATLLFHPQADAPIEIW